MEGERRGEEREHERRENNNHAAWINVVHTLHIII